MANYNIPANPQYSEQIRKLENTDSTSAEETFNPLISRIIENTAAVKKQVDRKAHADLSNVSTSILSKLTVGNADTVDGKHATDLQNYNNLANKPIIPTTLPANGGNADTVDGKHATDLQNYNNLTNKPTIPAAVFARSFTATLSATGWSSSPPYTQTVSVAGILTADNPVIDVVQSTTVDTAKQQLESWAMVSRVDTYGGSITAYCYEEKPTVALPIVLEVVR